MISRWEHALTQDGVRSLWNKFVVAITNWGPPATLFEHVCVRVCVLLVCTHTHTMAKPTTGRATEGAQMCRWLRAEVGLAFKSDSSHMAYGSNSGI